MDQFKKFLKEKKLGRHFKKSGHGVRLDSSTSSKPSATSGSAQGSNFDRVAAADIAAQAALKRSLKKETPALTSGQKKIQMIAQRELEEERRRNDPAYAMKQLGLEPKINEPEIREFEHSGAISDVYFTCELLGEDIVMKKSDLMEELEQFLIEKVTEDEDGVIPAVFMIYSLNKTAQKDMAIETIGKYLQNILEHPGEEKYRKIRVSNKAFQERVASAKGGKMFLLSVGFSEVDENDEPFLIINSPDDGKLIEALEALKGGQSVPIKVARCLEVFMIRDGQKITTPKLSADFFNVSAEEVKKEQQLKTEQADKMLMLRTKEMRKKDELLRNFKYKYTLIRIRLPGHLLLQGVFGCHEPFSAIRVFVASVLSDSAAVAQFSLRDSAGNSVNDESASLAEYGLAPAAVLHLDFSDPVDGDILDEHTLSLVQPLQ